jgi:glyoxylase-like metal-dependent hydrolase (beta-lactamase superfamily II)
MSATPDVRSFTVGLVQENCYIVRSGPEAKSAIIIDPGDEPERLLEAVRSLDVQIEAILLTHCHFDHIGAVAPVAKATGAPVYCPVIERPVLADVMAWVPPGFGPFESYEATCCSRARSGASTCPAGTGRRWSARSKGWCARSPPRRSSIRDTWA